METTENRTNYAFSFYDKNNELIDKLDGPGDIGSWLIDEDAPITAAIIPGSYEKSALLRKPALLTRTVRTPIGDKWQEIPEKSDECILYETDDILDAIALAKELGSNYIYWICWGEDRIIAVVETASPEPWDNHVREYYYRTYE
jgi:hypothetical protein